MYVKKWEGERNMKGEEFFSLKKLAAAYGMCEVFFERYFHETLSILQVINFAIKFMTIIILGIIHDFLNRFLVVSHAGSEKN